MFFPRKIVFVAVILVIFIPVLCYLTTDSRNYEIEEFEEKLFIRNYEETLRNKNFKSSAATILEKVRTITKCYDKPMTSQIIQKGNYWVLYNFIKAEKQFKCHETITVTTLADFTFLDNVVPLVERWQGPISIAIHAPGSDFQSTIESIGYLRDCTSILIRQLVTFHIFFPSEHTPDQIFLPSSNFDCSSRPPYLDIAPNLTYKSQQGLLFPINLARNIARESAQTHFVFPLDIELYPSPNLIPKFLKMISENLYPLTRTNFRVFPLAVFEIKSNQQIPESKTELLEMLSSGNAIPFHEEICAACHSIPGFDKWRSQSETPNLRVFYNAKRTGYHQHWEPFFIGTNLDPFYDERFTWEGQKDKHVQAYIMCVQDYDFLILDNAFLVHKPGIKIHKEMDELRKRMTNLTDESIKSEILPQLKILYGDKNGCTV